MASMGHHTNLEVSMRNGYSVCRDKSERPLSQTIANGKSNWSFLKPRRYMLERYKITI